MKGKEKDIQTHVSNEKELIQKQGECSSGHVCKYLNTVHSVILKFNVHADGGKKNAGVTVLWYIIPKYNIYFCQFILMKINYIVKGNFQQIQSTCGI
jgi:hypothetical protein